MVDDNKSIYDVINTITSSSCPTTVNFHCHTTYSDGSLDALQLYEQACNIKLSHLAITDHHSIKAYTLIKKTLADKFNNHFTTKLWSGIEISCLLKGCLVHVLGLDFDVDSPYLYPYIQGDSASGSYLNAKNVVKAIKQANGISILAHPARYRLDFNILIQEAISIGIDGVETWYDYDFSTAWKPSEFVCESIHNFCNLYNLLQTCGTDTHGYSLLSR